MRTFLAAAVSLFAASGASAGLFSGPSFFSTIATTSLSSSWTNNLVLTDTANGFVVSGQFIINMPPGFDSGSLLYYVVDRPLDPLYGGPGPIFTQTLLNGFSSPPAGSTTGATSGYIQSHFTNFVAPSQTQINLVLPAGPATVTNWTNLSASTTFTYTSGGTNYLRQIFDLDGSQVFGSGGQWVVDLPAETYVIPMPSSVAALALGGVFASRRRRA